MANPTLKGKAVVYGADGTISIAGTAIITLNQSASVTISDEVVEIKGSQGKVETSITVEDITDIDVEVIPSGTTSSGIANAKTASVLPRKNAKVITTGFAVADYNYDKWRVMEASSSITNTGALTLKLKCRKNEADLTADATA